jgi:hypothetical protein
MGGPGFVYYDVLVDGLYTVNLAATLVRADDRRLAHSSSA